MVPCKPLTKFQFAQLVLEQQGLCGCGCGEKLIFKKGQIRDEHLHQRSMGGSDEMFNRSLWRLPCTKPKDRRDAAIRKKDRRARRVTAKSRAPKAKIQSQGFYKHPTKKRTIGGKVVPR